MCIYAYKKINLNKLVQSIYIYIYIYFRARRFASCFLLLLENIYALFCFIVRYIFTGTEYLEHILSVLFWQFYTYIKIFLYYLS